MVDRISPERRSWLMARVKGQNTLPEIIVRRMAHSLGYRFRLHVRELPGSPDLVFPRRRAVVFVHGCFWHRHDGCRKATSPKSREDFWNEKFERNVARDRRVKSELELMGWRVLVVWECETRDPEKLALDLQAFL
ncbi:very short patch repair endonuclease [Caulobacter flavus]|uniref:Very short patch repair endonuclease n=1 Tax=Caulobacter flavus TaxID=1679497 RepID=A0A2N5CZ97_9CAUL|nr:very short patch repair endonuclease [Caulobacter flavus]AYV45183.1 very short patch repair endonuclease [Caulobacter flavus]PLR19137.1 very short patch repair endonuclease [Caulobacter flavus]